MTPGEARAALAGDRISPEDTFGVLRTISALANDSGRQSTARDLVIRVT